MKKIYCLVIFVMLTAVNNRLYSQTYEDQSKYPTESSQNILSLGPIGYCAIGGGGVVFAYLILENSENQSTIFGKSRCSP